MGLGVACRRNDGNRLRAFLLAAFTGPDILVGWLKGQFAGGFRMFRTGTLFVLIGAAEVSIQAMAVDPNRPVSPRRQLTICMNKHMSASRTISYNESTAVCKAQLKVKAPTLASSIQSKPPSGLSK